MGKKGISYSMDVAAAPRKMKYHKRGYKNIYTLVLDYFNEGASSHEQVSIPYGCFELAREKDSVERSLVSGWGGMRLLKTSLVVATYRGTRKLHEEVMFSKDGPRGEDGYGR